MRLTAKHLNKEEIVKCNALLNSVSNIHSCTYQAIEKNVVEYINAKEALLIAEKTVAEFKNNQALKAQLESRMQRAQARFESAKMALN